MAKALPHLRQQAVQAIQAQAKADNWDYSDYDCSMQEIEGAYDHTMPEILARSFIVYLHSTIEYNLAQVAADVRQRHNLALKHNEITGSAIERTRLYLTKVAQIGVTDLMGWNYLRDIAKVRDVVVHRGGELGSDAADRKSLRELSLRANGLVKASNGWDDPSSQLRVTSPSAPSRCQASLFFEALLDRTRPRKGSA